MMPSQAGGNFVAIYQYLSEQYLIPIHKGGRIGHKHSVRQPYV